MNLTESQSLQAQLIGAQPENRLTFEFLACESYDFSLDLTIRAEQSGGFGASRSAWFGTPELDTFWNDLRECERTRRGEARLKHISEEVVREREASANALFRRPRRSF